MRRRRDLCTHVRGCGGGVRGALARRQPQPTPSRLDTRPPARRDGAVVLVQEEPVCALAACTCASIYRRVHMCSAYTCCICLHQKRRGDDSGAGGRGTERRTGPASGAGRGPRASPDPHAGQAVHAGRLEHVVSPPQPQLPHVSPPECVHGPVRR